MGFFRRKKEPTYDIKSYDVPLSTIVRWFLIDIGYGEDRIDDLIGLNPISEEGLTKEFEDSDGRLSSLKPIIPFIETMSEIAANSLSTIAMKAADEFGESLEANEESAELLTSLYYSIAMSSIIGSFSIAAELGIIDITAIAAENKDMEDLFYE